MTTNEHATRIKNELALGNAEAAFKLYDAYVYEKPNTRTEAVRRTRLEKLGVTQTGPVSVTAS